MIQPPSCPGAPLDPAARATLATWVNDYWDGVYGLLYRLTGNQQEAEDLTQDVFLRAVQRRDSFVAGTNVRAWLMRIATNAFLDTRRRKKVARATPLAEEIHLPPTNEMAGGALYQQELGAALAAALLQVPEPCRAVFLLRTREDLSFREIAHMLGGTEENARWHMLQARRRLMELMKGWL